MLNITCTKEFEVIEKEKVIVLSSKSYSNVHLNDNIKERTILPYLSVIIDDAPSQYSYDAYTFGETSTNVQLGERIDWEGSFTAENDTTTQTFGTSAEYFFLYVRNQTSTSYGPIVINYNNADEYTENILIPANNGITYRIAYYKVHSDTKIRFYDSNNQSNYITLTAGTSFHFPNTENQCVVVNITDKKTYAEINSHIPKHTLKPDNLNF